MSTDRKAYYRRKIAALVSSVVIVFHGALFLNNFKTDAWAMKVPWFNDAGIVCCYGLFIIGGLWFIVSTVDLLVAFTTKPDEP